MGADGVIERRFAELERFRDETERWRRHVDRDRVAVEYLRTEMGDLTEAVNSLRRLLLTFALSIAGSAVVFALSVLIATNRIP